MSSSLFLILIQPYVIEIPLQIPLLAYGICLEAYANNKQSTICLFATICLHMAGGPPHECPVFYSGPLFLRGAGEILDSTPEGASWI